MNEFWQDKVSVHLFIRLCGSAVLKVWGKRYNFVFIFIFNETCLVKFAN